MENIVKFSEYEFKVEEAKDEKVEDTKDEKAKDEKKVEEGNQPGYEVDELKNDVTSGLGTAKKVDAVSTKVTGKFGKDMEGGKLNNTLPNTPIKPFGKTGEDVVQDGVPVKEPGTASSTPVKTFDNFYKTTTDKTKEIKDKKDLNNKL